MKLVLLFYFFLFIVIPEISWSQNVSVPEIRNELFYSDFDQTQTKLFYEKIYAIRQKTPVVIAYQGVAEALLAKVVWNPFTKINYLKTSRDNLQQAVNQAPENIEIRFLRLSTQYYLPSIMGFSSNLPEDKAAIMKNIESLDQEELDGQLLKFIFEFMIDSNLCSNEEMQKIQTILGDKKS